METLSLPRTKEEISHLIDQWKVSGKSKKDFCSENNIKYLTFIDWTCKRGQRRERNKKHKIGSFIPVSIQEPIKQFFAEVHLSPGTRIVIHQSVPAEYLRSLIK